jgi:acetyl esterase/lipase
VITVGDAGATAPAATGTSPPAATDTQPPAATATPPAAATSTPPEIAGVAVHEDLEYASYQLDGTEHKLHLDLYLPQQSTPQLLAVLVFVHGGGWFEGSKETCPGQTLALNGYAVACVDYRLANYGLGCPQKLTFPAQIHDVKAAVRWLRLNADQYGLDPQRFGAFGDSSGGHLVALLGTSSGVTELEGTQNPGVSAAVQAVSVWYGPVDVAQSPIVFEDDPCTTDQGYLIDTYGGEETPYFYWTLAWGTFLGGSLADPAVLDRAAQASPLTSVDPDDPPFLVIQGQDDDMIPVGQSELLVAALNDAGVDVEFVQPAGVGHGFVGPPGSGQEVVPEILQPTLEFFDRYLKGD